MDRLIDLLPLSYTNSVVLIGAVILGATAGALGTFAVFRGRSLVGDALSHATLPGVAVAFIATGAKDAGTLLVGAALAAALAAVLMVGIERAGRLPADAAIGVVLSGFFSLGIVLLTLIASHGNANQAGLESYLFGQAAGLLERDLVVMAVLAGAALLAVVLAFRPLKLTLFDPAFAAAVGLPVRLLELAMTGLLVVAIVIGIRTVGAILMVALIVVPAVAARQLTGSLGRVLVLAAAIGAGVGAAGALASTAWNVPTGPVIVLCGFLVVLAAIALAPGRGVLWRSRALARRRRRRLVEGVLIDLETAIHSGPPPTERELLLAGGRRQWPLRRALRDLDRAGMLEREQGRLHLSESGAAAVHALLARRELWSAWLEHGWQLELPDAREPDPEDLRGSLGDELAGRLERLAAGEAA
jgi:manganese/zinc/iron transport system permease protein